MPETERLLRFQFANAVYISRSAAGKRAVAAQERAGTNDALLNIAQTQRRPPWAALRPWRQGGRRGV